MTSRKGGTGSFLVVTQYYPPERGAAQVRLAALARELHRRGNRVEVLTAIPNYPTGRLFPGWRSRPVQVADEDGVRVVRVWLYASMGSGVRRMLNYASFGAMSVVGLARTRRAGWTVVEYPTLFGALPAATWGRLRRRRVVVNVADLWVDAIVEVGAVGEGRLVDLLRRVEAWMLRNATAVTAVTEGVREALVEKGVDPEKICWLPNGADADAFSPGPADPAVDAELGLEPGEHLFLYAGTQGYVHGLEVVLDAAEQLRDLPVRFVLVGGGSEKPDLQRAAAERGLANVTFRDPVAPEDVARYLRRATAGLASVRDLELFRSVRSAKMFPTMATGRPVLYAGDDEGAALVRRAGAGIATAPGDGAALADAVRRVLDHPDEAEAMGAAGRRWIEEEGSWRVLIERWLADLDRVAPG
ncbi:MAG: glycosyltransferase family 4 protein [Acidimicrobiales bacterium]|nr:glycosyltransferase family 4 protein [Actinomycetota bacterium]